MATKRTAGLLAACVVAAIVVAGLLGTCEETVNSSPESVTGAPATAGETATTKPVAPRRARAAKGEANPEETDPERDIDIPVVTGETEPFVVVPVEVVDAETGQPIRGATVSNEWKYPRQWAVSAEDAVTNESGRAAAHLRPAALNRISTRAAAHVPSTDLVRTAPVGSAQPTLRIELAPGGELRGVVYDPNGKPVEGAVVDVRRDDVDDVLQSEESGADGSYVVEGLVLGASHTASTSGGLRGASEYCGSANSRPLVPTREHPVVVADHRLRRYGTIELTVLDGDEAIDDSLLVKLAVKLSSDDAVSFRAGGGANQPIFVAPGKCSLVLWFEDRTVVRRTVEVPEGGMVKATIHLTRGETISGLVVDDAGAPVEDAWIRDGVPPDDPREPRAVTQSRADGAFELTQLTTGDHELRVSPPFEFDDVVVRVAAPSESVRLVVPRRGVLKLRAVFDDAKAAADARIAFHGTLDGKPWDIDRLLPRDGRFEIPWPAGVSGDVGIAVDGFVPVTRSMTVPPGTAVDLGEIRMQPACSLAGVLRHDDGAPWNEATLVVRGVMGEWKCKTSSTGRFSFGRLAAGALRVDLADSPHASFLADVPSVKDVVLVVPKSGLLQVFASNSSGQRLAARRVDVIDDSSVAVDSGTTDANGSWTSHIVAGRYRVSVENGPHADAEVRAEDVTVLRLR